MKLGIWSTYYYDLSPEDAVKEFLKNGIHACELSDEHGAALLARDEDVVATGKRFAAFLHEHDFSIPQGHLWLYVKICSDENALTGLYRWIDLYEAIGIKNMVLHCDSSIAAEADFETRVEKNVEQLKRLAAYVEGKDVTICLENLRGTTRTDPKAVPRNADELLYIIDRVGSDHFGICLDTGHLNLTDKDQRAFILKAGKRLRALHIADNEGERDQHLMPFTCGKVDFCEVVRALREVGYDGLFNLEIPGEWRIPLVLRAAKIRYIQACYDYLMHGE